VLLEAGEVVVLRLAAALGDVAFFLDAFFLATAAPPLDEVTLGCGRLFLWPVTSAFRGSPLEAFFATKVLSLDRGRFFLGPRFPWKAAPLDDVAILDGGRLSFRVASFPFDDFASEGLLGT
jgi:hypothetical protein